ncbi:thiamine phosphate synthase [Virgibacillus siamensis]|uniref:thiamine phosphate synthase n=1 Tax=Virgibacillus siamensis TaxID=480071 RepID=UPI001FE83F1C|nr:thiamine phosphate synthase [Virgibacillus siamensis]
MISTGKQSPGTLAGILEKIHPYVDFFHLREKRWTNQEMVTTIHLFISKGIPLEKIIINSRIEVAQSMHTHGVQLTHTADVEMVRKAHGSLYIGCSVHSLGRAVYADEHGADFLLYGHIFETQSKPGLKPRGLSSLKNIAQNTKTPVIAIGGITPENTPVVVENGATGVAVLSGILLSDDPVKAAQKYRKALDEKRLN